MVFSPMQGLDILFASLTVLVLTSIQKTMYLHEDNKTAEYKVTCNTLMYGIFLFVNVYYFNRRRYFCLESLLKQTLRKVRRIYEKSLVILSKIQYCQHVESENILIFYLKSILIFAIHCSPLICALYLRINIKIYLLGLMFTALLFIGSSDIDDRLLIVVRLRCISYFYGIVCICFCILSIIYRDWKTLYFIIASVTAVIFNNRRTEKQPLYRILELCKQYQLYRDRRNLQKQLYQVHQQKRMQTELVQKNKGFEEEHMQHFMDPIPFNQEMYCEPIEINLLNSGMDHELVEQGELNQGMDRELFEQDDFKQGMNPELFESDEVNQRVDRELFEPDRSNRGMDRELFELDDLKEEMNRELFESEEVNQKVDHELFEPNELNQGIDRILKDLDRCKQVIKLLKETQQLSQAETVYERLEVYQCNPTGNPSEHAKSESLTSNIKCNVATIEKLEHTNSSDVLKSKNCSNIYVNRAENKNTLIDFVSKTKLFEADEPSASESNSLYSNSCNILPLVDACAASGEMENNECQSKVNSFNSENYLNALFNNEKEIKTLCFRNEMENCSGVTREIILVDENDTISEDERKNSKSLAISSSYNVVNEIDLRFIYSIT